MRNLKERWKIKAAIGLTAIMLTVQLPVEVFAEETGPVVIQEITAASELQEQFNSASMDAENPTTITLSGDVTASGNETALVIPEDRYVTLDLNGHTIDRGLENKEAVANGNVITVKGDLTLTDSSDNQSTPGYDGTGKLTGGNNQGNGGGVFVNNGGTFTMKSGSISACSVTSSGYGNGGGVCVASGGTFTMKGGSITDCSATATGEGDANGGGVYVMYMGIFTMEGGSVSACSATATDEGDANGGGVYVNNGGTFTMEGGSISACAATGTGLHASPKGGGVYVDYRSTFNVSGTPVVSGNKHQANDSATPVVDNVFLSSETAGTATVTVTAALGEDASIGVCAGKSESIVIARGTDSYVISAGDAEKFHHDATTYTLVRDVENDKYVIRQEKLGSWSELQAKLQYGGNTVRLDSDYTADISDTALVVPAGRTVTLDLNDHYILYKGTEKASLITVNGSLTLKDSKTQKTKRYVTLTDGRATDVSDSGTVSDTCIEVTGGFIAGGNHENNNGGGVYVKDSCMFTMEGGTIAGCKAYYGGGVNVNNSGMFTMEDGTIAGCKALYGGGGVFINDTGNFYMNGGGITNCTAIDSDNTRGGGVFIFNSGKFNMEGGSITDCTADSGGGVYVYSGTFKVSGTPVIRDNKKGSDANNVAFNGSKTITVTGVLTTGAEIHINAGKGTTVAEKGGSRTDPLTETEAGYFKSDVDSNLLGGLNDAGNVVFKEPLPGLKGAGDLTYNGAEQIPALTFSGDPAPALTAGTDYTVSYKKVVGDTETALSGAPKDAGSYKAVAVGKGSYAGTSEVSFTIAPKPVTVAGIKAKNKVYDATTDAMLDCSSATFAGKVDDDRLTVTATGAFEDANAGKDRTVAINGLTLGGDSKDNYVLAENGHQTTTTATITRAMPEVTAPTASATYMENLSIVKLNNPTDNLPGTWTWATDNGINPNETAVGAVGTHVFRAKFTPTDTANYCEITKDVTVTVGKAKPKLTIESFSAPYGHPVSVKSSCNSDGKVTYVFYKSDGKTKTNTEDGAETEGGAPKNAGTYNIVASVAETSNYLSDEQTLAQGCVITQAPNPAVLRSTVTVKRGSGYDLSGLVSGAKGTVNFVLNGSPAGYSLSGSTLTLDSNAADSCTITVTADGTVDGKSNYEIFSGEITVYATDLDPQDSFGFADVAQEKTYGDGDFTVAATGAETGSNVTYSSDDPDVATVEEETGKVHILKAGEATITATAGATDTYAAATASYKLTVYPKPVTISGIKADDLVYDSAIAQGITLNTAGAKIDGMMDGDELTVEEAIGMCEEADVGENKTVTIRTITLGGSSVVNYTVDLENSQKTTKINITKADIPNSAITAPTGKNGLVYTGLAQSLVDAGTALGGEMRYALGTDTTAPADKLYSASIPAAVNAGNYYVWYMVKGDRNHNDYVSNEPVTVTIEKASGKTVNADVVELQKGNDIQASVNIRGYVGTGAVITGTPQVTPESVSGISITDISVSNDKNNLTFTVSSANGGNAIITLTLTSDNYDSVTLTIPVKVQDRVTEVKLEPASGVESSVQSVTADGLDDYTDTQSGESVKVVLEVKPENEPQGSAVKTKIDNSVKVIFNGVEEGDLKTEYLDISITKQVGTGAANPVGDVGRVLELAIRYDLSGKFHPVVIREHEGTVKAFTALNAKPNENYQDGTFYIDEDQGIIYIYSRYFSTFSIASTTVNSHTVSFDAKGGSSVDPIIVADGGKISNLPTSTRSGYTLDGWFTYASGGEKLTTDTVITADITYCAQWTQNSSGGGGSGGGGGGGGTPTTVAVTGVTVSPKTAAITLSENKAVQFTATVTPEDATDKTVTWSQSSTDGGEVVLGSETANPVTVTAAKAGTVTLTATSTDGSWTDTATITITEAPSIPVTGVEVTPMEVELPKGETLKLNAKVMPEDATDKTVTWASSDTTKVTVTEDGVIEAVAAGTAAVTATAGDVTGSATVTVTEDKAKEKVIEETEEETKTEIAEDLGGGRINDLIGTDPSDTGTVVTVDKDGNITDTKVWVGSIKSEYKYTGKSITPEPHVYDGTTKLVKGTDYTVSYKNNKTAGKASLTVRFKGNYKNEPRTVSFEIRPAELGEDVIVTAAAQEAGKAVKPGLTYVMKATGAAITPGKFGVNPAGKITIPEGGKQEVTVTARDTVNFTGTAVVGIEAAPKAKLLNKAAVTISPKSYTYTSGEIVPEEKAYTVKLGGTVLKYGTDYRIAEILGNVEPGKATVFIEGAGDYKGSRTANFTISKGFDLTNTDKAVILVNGEEKASVKYAKGGVTPGVAVYLNGLKLVKGTDYTLKFSGNKAVGKSAEVKVTFKGKYKGEKTASFEIEPQELDELSVVAEDKIKSNKADFYKNPKLTITDLNGKKLGKNDYTVGNDYIYDEEKGEVKVALKGKGNYSGEEYKLVYRVIAKDQDIKGASAAKIADKAYTGRAIELTDSDLAGRLKLGGKTLTPGEDFEIDEKSYRNNVNTGEASVVIRGKGTMGGVKTLKFKIVQNPVNWNGAYMDGKFSK